ncbi:FUSC family protein [Micromonospora sp. CPCC 205556]|uniref:FUSC family protein n=1 Tax=Micromonospora sp. CPCC 205556 TaxID=3122398 RepID=UPI002FF3055B
MNLRRWAEARRSELDMVGPGLFRHRMRVAAPMIAQSALLAGAAWWIAQTVFDHESPIFAATASLICLTAGMGGRARQALDLFVGVLSGVLVGTVVRALDAGNEVWLIAPAIALSMTLAALVDPRPLTYIQSGGAVLIVVAVGSASSPTDYVLDAAVGGAIGLVGSQVLFTPDPVKLVTAPVREILRDFGAALRIAAESLHTGAPERAGTACEDARDAHARLGALTQARMAARRVSGRTVRGRRRAAHLRRVNRPLDDIDVLGAAVLLLCDDVQALLASDPTPMPGRLPTRLTELADGLTELADHPLLSMSGEPSDQPGGRPHPGISPHPEPSPATEVHLSDALAALHRLRTAASDPSP